MPRPASPASPWSPPCASRGRDLSSRGPNPASTPLLTTRYVTSQTRACGEDASLGDPIRLSERRRGLRIGVGAMGHPTHHYLRPARSIPPDLSKPHALAQLRCGTQAARAARLDRPATSGSQNPAARRPVKSDRESTGGQAMLAARCCIIVVPCPCPVKIWPISCQIWSASHQNWSFRGRRSWALVNLGANLPESGHV